MPRKTMDILFPAAGVVRRQVLRASPRGQGPYPAPWAHNVRLEDSLTNRLRGGSFVGISAGSRPSEIRYRDRLVTFSSNAITMSRQGNDSDTALSADLSDSQRPALIQFSYGGAIGGTVVALVPHKDLFMLGFTADETWVQHGNPHNGRRSRVSDEVGIVGADAWCVNHDTVYFLSSRGLYSVGADGSGLKAISEDAIPEHLIGVADATLTYKHSDRGVYIHVTGAADWFYDTARDGFWPFNAGGGDSHLLIGPLRLGTPDWRGLIQTLHGIMAAGSATVNWFIVPGETAEQATANGKAAIEAHLAGSSYSSYIKASGSWSAGREQTAMPRVSAMWACLWLSSASAWAYEGITMTTIPAGRWRK